jgi:predicted esterase
MHSATSTSIAADCAYGTHPRQRLDVYAARHCTDKAKPVLVWVHGGGFVRGEKRSPDHPFNAHVGAFAARCGWVGVVMNYRLAPEYGWPAGGEDVGAVVDWLKRHASEYGGNPNKIFLAATSAGAIHVATYLHLRGETHGVRGAILLSGLYGATPLEATDRLYYGTDEAQYPARFPLPGIVNCDLPLLIACAEFDPERFQTEWRCALDALQKKRGRLPWAHFASGHNHYTLAMHIGTTDTRLSDEIVQFVRHYTAESPGVEHAN